MFLLIYVTMNVKAVIL